MKHNIQSAALHPEAKNGLDHLENRLQAKLSGRVRNLRVVFQEFPLMKDT
jgi:hypothetical protein